MGGIQSRFSQHTEQSQFSACAWRGYWFRLFFGRHLGFRGTVKLDKAPTFVAGNAPSLMKAFDVALQVEPQVFTSARPASLGVSKVTLHALMDRLMIAFHGLTPASRATQVLPGFMQLTMPLLTHCATRSTGTPGRAAKAACAWKRGFMPSTSAAAARSGTGRC